MQQSNGLTRVYVESGDRRVFSGALDWPGWCRGVRGDESEALAALLAYGPRYGAAVAETGMTFEPPTSSDQLVVVERLDGDSTTDFGAPGAVPGADRRPVAPVDADRLRTLLEASWNAFEQALLVSKHHTLRTGPRGGGRDQAKMVDHVIEAQVGYLARIGRRVEPPTDGALEERAGAMRRRTLSAFDTAVRHGVPEKGPRGGTRWPLPYFVRRSAWHCLDHAWEIEDRLS